MMIFTPIYGVGWGHGLMWHPFWSDDAEKKSKYFPSNLGRGLVPALFTLRRPHHFLPSLQWRGGIGRTMAG